MSTQANTRAAKAISECLAIEDVLSDICNAITENIPPEDIYDEKVLIEWAENNGFVKANE